MRSGAFTTSTTFFSPKLSPPTQPPAYSPSTYAHEGTPTGGDCWRCVGRQVEGSNPGTLPVPILPRTAAGSPKGESPCANKRGSPQRRRGTRRVGVIHRVLRVGQKSCREVARCCFTTQAVSPARLPATSHPSFGALKKETELFSGMNGRLMLYKPLKINRGYAPETVCGPAGSCVNDIQRGGTDTS